MANSTVSLFNDYGTEAKAIERKRKMADLLAQQALEPLVTNQTAGGYVIPTSNYAGLAKLLNAGSSAYFNKKLDTQEKELNQRYRSEGNDALVKGMELMRGKAAQPEIPTAPDEIGGGPGRAAQPAVAPDMQGAAAAFGKHPLTQPYSAALFAQALKGNDPYTLAPGAVRMEGNKPVASAPNRPLADNRPELVRLQETAANLLPTDPGYEQIQARIKKLTDVPGDRIDYNKPFLPDGKPNPAYQEFALRRAKSGATNVSVSTDKSYFGNVAEGLAKQDVAAIDAARSAPQRVDSARSVKSFLDKNPITGTFAESRLSFEKALATAGLIDGERVKDTESLAANLASQTLDAIKSSGLGTGNGFTDKDRAFLERAKSGNIEVNAGTLRQLADLNERSAVASIKRGNELIRKLKGNKQMGAVGVGLDEIPEPSAAGGGAFRVLSVRPN